jgi:cation transport regulator ChaC
MAGRWVFGYGSLVSPKSFGHTVGREFRPGRDFFEAEVLGYGRRWSFATAARFTAAAGPGLEHVEWTTITLGVVRSGDESTNGVIGWVNDGELDELDRREARYDRVDVTAVTNVAGTSQLDDPIVTYVPRDDALQIYEAARAVGRAAVSERYWNLVDGAFAALGEGQRARYHATTPPPRVPIVTVPDGQVPERHRE